MLNGRPDIDIEALRPYCIFQGNASDWHEMCEPVLWLWQALREFNEEGRRNFLKFFTGNDGEQWSRLVVLPHTVCLPSGRTAFVSTLFLSDTYPSLESTPLLI